MAGDKKWIGNLSLKLFCENKLAKFVKLLPLNVKSINLVKKLEAATGGVL